MSSTEASKNITRKNFKGDVLGRSFKIEQDENGMYSFQYADPTEEQRKALNSIRYFRYSSSDIQKLEEALKELLAKEKAIILPPSGPGGPENNKLKPENGSGVTGNNKKNSGNTLKSGNSSYKPRNSNSKPENNKQNSGIRSGKNTELEENKKQEKLEKEKLEKEKLEKEKLEKEKIEQEALENLQARNPPPTTTTTPPTTTTSLPPQSNKPLAPSFQNLVIEQQRSMLPVNNKKITSTSIVPYKTIASSNNKNITSTNIVPFNKTKVSSNNNKPKRNNKKIKTRKIGNITGYKPNVAEVIGTTESDKQLLKNNKTDLYYEYNKYTNSYTPVEIVQEVIPSPPTPTPTPTGNLLGLEAEQPKKITTNKGKYNKDLEQVFNPSPTKLTSTIQNPSISTLKKYRNANPQVTPSLYGHQPSSSPGLFSLSEEGNENIITDQFAPRTISQSSAQTLGSLQLSESSSNNNNKSQNLSRIEEESNENEKKRGFQVVKSGKPPLFPAPKSTVIPQLNLASSKEGEKKTNGLNNNALSLSSGSISTQAATLNRSSRRGSNASIVSIKEGGRRKRQSRKQKKSRKTRKTRKH